MTKRQRESKEKKRKPKRLRRGHKNPFVFPSGVPPVGFDGLASGTLDLSFATDYAGTLLIQQALHGASFQEKMIIATLIPLVLPILRKGASVTVDASPQSANAANPQTPESPEESANTK